MIVCQVSLNFDPVKGILKIRCQNYEEGSFSEEDTCGNEVFHSTFLLPFQFEPKDKKTRGNYIHVKKTKHIHASAADLLHIRIRNLDSCNIRATLQK